MLGVWYGTKRVGVLRAPAGRLRLAYDPEWLQSGFPISLSLPFSGEEERDAHAFFEGLLPEGRARRRITRELHLSLDDDVGLLAAIGRDCAGALSVLPERETPSTTSEPRILLEARDLHALVDSRGAATPAALTPQRFSLAGAQDKLALHIEGSALSMPSATHPSTHLLKFETLRWVCFAEYMGSELARRVGMEACVTEYARAPDTELPYLQITRFDRRAVAGEVQRLHQEDVTQALGLPSDEKYQQDGGPSLGAVADLLRGYVRDPLRDVIRVRDWQLLNYLIGNSDAHAKNLSLLYDPNEDAPELAPFYDLVCIEFFNRIGAARFDRTMAFFVGERSDPESIRRLDWEAMANSMHVAPRALLERLGELTEALPVSARESRGAFATRWGDNQVYDRWVETIADRCRWVQQNVLKR